MADDFLDDAARDAFAKIERAGGDACALRDPLRTVALVYAAQEIIDNGGLHFFFESDWPSQPPYAVFVEAYRNVGATAEADVLSEAAALFGLVCPEVDRVRRCEMLEGSVGDRLTNLASRMTSDVWLLLAAYARANEAAIARDR